MTIILKSSCKYVQILSKKNRAEKKLSIYLYTKYIYAANLVQWALVNIGSCYTRIDMRRTYAVRYECSPTWKLDILTHSVVNILMIRWSDWIRQTSGVIYVTYMLDVPLVLMFLHLNKLVYDKLFNLCAPSAASNQIR